MRNEMRTNNDKKIRKKKRALARGRVRKNTLTFALL